MRVKRESRVTTWRPRVRPQLARSGPNPRQRDRKERRSQLYGTTWTQKGGTQAGVWWRHLPISKDTELRHLASAQSITFKFWELPCLFSPEMTCSVIFHQQWNLPPKPAKCGEPHVVTDYRRVWGPKPTPSSKVHLRVLRTNFSCSDHAHNTLLTTCL